LWGNALAIQAVSQICHTLHVGRKRKNRRLKMGKLSDFLFKAANVVIDSAAGATNDTIQEKVSEQNQKSQEKKQAKKQNKETLNKR